MNHFRYTISNVIRRALALFDREIIVRKANQGSPPGCILGALLEHQYLCGNKGWIIQVGANDGVMADPLHDHLSHLDLPALLIEPLPHIYENLHNKYCNSPSVKCECVAIDEAPGSAMLYYIDPDAKHLPDWTQGVGSFRRETVMKHANWPGMKELGFERYVREQQVAVVTGSALLARHGIKEILLLQIDTEGHDFCVIRSFLKSGCLPLLINYENVHLSYPDASACRIYLDELGYKLIDIGIDTLAIHDTFRQQYLKGIGYAESVLDPQGRLTGNLDSLRMGDNLALYRPS